MQKGPNPHRVRVKGPNGEKVSLASLPLVAFELRCGHIGREYAVAVRDLVFCDECRVQKSVKRIIAQ